jgi:hypothetical protein
MLCGPAAISGLHFLIPAGEKLIWIEFGPVT